MPNAYFGNMAFPPQMYPTGGMYGGTAYYYPPQAMMPYFAPAYMMYGQYQQQQAPPQYQALPYDNQIAQVI